MINVNYMEENKIICICRRLYGEDLLKLAHAIYEGGLRMMEVTFDQADPACVEKTTQAIAMLNHAFGGAMHIGAGTVLNPEQVEAARDAGAEYIISPNTNLEVIRRTKELGLLSIPGAMTPSEILTAHDSGADLVKLFPTAYLGLDYIKDISGPISHVKLLATGGIHEGNLRQYLDAGLVGAGISGRLTERRLIEEGNFAAFTARARAFVEITQGRSERGAGPDIR